MELLERIGSKVLDWMREDEQSSVMKTASGSFGLSRAFLALRSEDADVEVLAASSLYSAARFRRLKVDMGMPKVTFKGILEAADEFQFARKSAQELASYYNELFLPALRGNFRNTFKTNQDTTAQVFANDQTQKEYGPSRKRTRVSDEFFSTPQRLAPESERCLETPKPSVELESSAQSGKVSQSNYCTAPGLKSRVPSDKAFDVPLEKLETKPESSAETIEAAPATNLEPETGIENAKPAIGSGSIAASSRSVVLGNAKSESTKTNGAAVDSEVRSGQKKPQSGESDPISTSVHKADRTEKKTQVVGLVENSTKATAESMHRHELIRAAKTLLDLGVAMYLDSVPFASFYLTSERVGLACSSRSS